MTEIGRRDDAESVKSVDSSDVTPDSVDAPVAHANVTVTDTANGSVIVVATMVSTLVAMGLAILRLRHGLALVGDSGSYLAGASGFSDGRWFETPLVPSFSEIPLLDTVNDAGWSSFTDFGVGTPLIIAFFDLFLPLRHAAGAVNVLAIGSIAAAVVIGPWASRRRSELWARSILAVALSCWPILRFTGVGVLSEPVFCAAVLWLAVMLGRLSPPSPRTHSPQSHGPGSHGPGSQDVHQHEVQSPVHVEPRTPMLIVLGVLTVITGFTRFVGPTVAVVVAVLLLGYGVSWRRAGWWFLATGLVPTTVTWLASRGTRAWSFHSRSADDIFFLARGVGGWFEAGMGDQTSTLLRQSFRPSLVEWAIALAATSGAIVVMWNWFREIRHTRARIESSPGSRAAADRRHNWTPGPAVILATALALVIVPSMFFLDAILKLENRIMMPSGVLVISAAGWWLASKASAPLALGGVCLWAVVATHPWHWLERPAPSRPTTLTAAVRDLEVRNAVEYVITNQADLVWWHTGVPARYLPSGDFNRSDRTYDPRPIMAALPCALARTNGAIVVDMNVGLPEPLILEDQLSLDVAAGRYDRVEITPGIVTYQPTGRSCG